jgi:hypothetical protein
LEYFCDRESTAGVWRKDFGNAGQQCRLASLGSSAPVLNFGRHVSAQAVANAVFGGSSTPKVGLEACLQAQLLLHSPSVLFVCDNVLYHTRRAAILVLMLHSAMIFEENFGYRQNTELGAGFV